MTNLGFYGNTARASGGAMAISTRSQIEDHVSHAKPSANSTLVTTPLTMPSTFPVVTPEITSTLSIAAVWRKPSYLLTDELRIVISDSIFADNFAHAYGGHLYREFGLEAVKFNTLNNFTAMTVRNSQFIRGYANDSGGAISFSSVKANILIAVHLDRWYVYIHIHMDRHRVREED